LVQFIWKYLHIPRPLYTWYLRDDSESHRKIVPANFNNNFKIALDKLNQSDGGVDKMFNDIYIETSTLGSYDFKNLKGKKVSLWTRVLSQGQKETLQSLYYDIDLVFNDTDSEIHIFSLNYFNESDLTMYYKKQKVNK
jgi:hypothetical protein